MMRADLFLGVVVTALALGGCPASGDADDASTSVADGGSGSGDGDGDGSATSGGSGSDDGGVCEPPVTGVPQTTVLTTVRNDTAAPIFIDLACGSGVVNLSGPMANPAQLSFPVCSLPPCNELLEGGCTVGCPGAGGACAPTVYRLEPGEVYEDEWKGTSWTDSTVPAVCAGDCPVECHLEQQAPSGTYTASVYYFTECPSADPAECECPAGETGCLLNYWDGEPPDGLTTEATFDFPNETMPVIAVE